MIKRTMLGGLLVAAQILGSAAAFAGPWEDGMAAYNRGDYVPAIQVFRVLAAEGNTRAQRVLGTMYHKGQGVAHNSVRAFAWLSRAAARGDKSAEAQLHEVAATMTPEELAEAKEMAQACEASDYRNCEY
jgi:TPR repeat protein